MTAAFAAVTWVAAAVLGWAGTAKVRRPQGTGAALALAGLPGDVRLVRVLGAGEVILAALVLTVGGPAPTVLLGVAYLTFAAFSWMARRHPGALCGCFGGTATPLTPLHTAVDVVAATAALGAAATGAPAPSTMLAAGPVPAAAGLLALVTGAACVTLALTAVPALADAVRGAEVRGPGVRGARVGGAGVRGAGVRGARVRGAGEPAAEVRG